MNRDEPRPVVLFAEKGQPEQIAAALEAGVAAYVVEGLSPAKVRPVLEVVCSAGFGKARPRDQHARRAGGPGDQREIRRRVEGHARIDHGIDCEHRQACHQQRLAIARGEDGGQQAASNGRGRSLPRAMAARERHVAWPADCPGPGADTGGSRASACGVQRRSRSRLWP